MISVLITLVLAFTEALAVSCDLSKVSQSPNPTAYPNLLPNPNGPLTSLLFAFGIQNYNCTNSSSNANLNSLPRRPGNTTAASGNYMSVGAVATLLDASCATKTEFPIFLQTLFDTWNATDSTSLTPPSNLMSILMGQHYFQNSSPVWDFRIKGGMASGNSNAFVVGNKTNNAPSPLGPGNADWLKLNGTLGALAREIYRTDTLGGSPPKTCDPQNENSSVIQVKYVAAYRLHNGNDTSSTKGTPFIFPANFTFPTDNSSATSLT